MMFLGIDTSCYTTSAALVDDSGSVVFDKRIPLIVKENGRGLRQSEMVFMHIRNVSSVMPACIRGLKAVGASVSPRPAEGSYMPVFTVSESVGRCMSASGCCDFFPLTHQHGHIGAALLGNDDIPDRFIAVHVSGGTTEMTAVEKENGVIRSIEILGGTSDIAAGQFIDRIGVKMGLRFPAGPHIEEIARDGGNRLKISARGAEVSFSGAETAAGRLLEKGEANAAVAFAVEECIAGTLMKLIDAGRQKTGTKPVVMCGGVMSNGYIRDELKRLGGPEIYFAKREYASDNACGIAAQTRLIYLNERN